MIVPALVGTGAVTSGAIVAAADGDPSQNLGTYWTSFGVVGASVVALAIVCVYLYRSREADRVKAEAHEAAALATQRTEHEHDKGEWQTQLTYVQDERERDRVRFVELITEASRRTDHMSDELRRLETDYRERGTSTLAGVSTALTEALRELRRANRGE